MAQERSTARRAGALAALAAGTLLAAGLAGCAERGEPVHRVEAEGPDVRLSGYPFRPAPFYNIDHMDELTGPAGYTAGY